MRLFFLVGFTLLSPLSAADRAPSADTPAAVYARETQLPAHISINQKGLPLIDFLKDLAAEVEKQQLKTPKWTYAAEISKTQPISYSCTDKPLVQVLNDVFKPLGLGYVVISKDGDKYDGFIRIVKGDDRGHAKGSTPAAASDDDKQAAARLASAKELIQEGQTGQARAVLKLLVKTYPGSPAAKEAAKVLETLGP